MSHKVDYDLLPKTCPKKDCSQEVKASDWIVEVGALRPMMWGSSTSRVKYKCPKCGNEMWSAVFPNS